MKIKKLLVFLLLLLCICITNVFALDNYEEIYVCPLNGISFYVNFNTNGGGTVSSIGVGGHNYEQELPVIEKEGYVFSGWYYDETFTEKFLGTKLYDIKHGEGSQDEHGCFVAPGVTLYAYWEIEPPHLEGGSYQILYATNGGNEIESTSVCVGCAGGQYKLPIPIRNGYKFEGWYYDETLTNKVKGEYVDDVGGTNLSSVTIYAKWVVDSNEDNPHTGYFLNCFAICGVLIVITSTYIYLRNFNKFMKI